MEKEAYIVCRHEGSRILATEYAEGGSSIVLAENVTSAKPDKVELGCGSSVRIYLNRDEAEYEAKLRGDIMGDKKIRLLKIKVDESYIIEVPYKKGKEIVVTYRTNKFSWDCLCFF
jgi:hypothetical protein